MNIAIVPLFSDADLLRWLGAKRVMHRTLDKLCEVRELDEIRVVGTEKVDLPDLKDSRLRMVTTKEPIPSMLRLCRLFHVGVQREDVYLAVNPAFPFLGTDRIESVLHSVLSGKAAAYTGTGRWDVRSGGGVHHCAYVLVERAAYVNACLAVYQPAGGCEMGEAHVLDMNCDVIPINAIEAVDVSTPEGWRLAEAVSLGIV